MATHASILTWRIPMDRGAWRVTVHGVAKIRTQLSDEVQHSTFPEPSASTVFPSNSPPTCLNSARGNLERGRGIHSAIHAFSICS